MDYCCEKFRDYYDQKKLFYQYYDEYIKDSYYRMVIGKSINDVSLFERIDFCPFCGVKL